MSCGLSYMNNLHNYNRMCLSSTKPSQALASSYQVALYNFRNARFYIVYIYRVHLDKDALIEYSACRYTSLLHIFLITWQVLISNAMHVCDSGLPIHVNDSMRSIWSLVDIICSATLTWCILRVASSIPYFTAQPNRLQTHSLDTEAIRCIKVASHVVPDHSYITDLCELPSVQRLEHSGSDHGGYQMLFQPLEPTNRDIISKLCNPRL
jgi:hypothetical protein